MMMTTAADHIPPQRGRARRAPCATGRRRLQRGITFVDVTVSTLIIGILAGAASPRFAAALQDVRVRSAAARIRADMEYARSVAQAGSRDETVAFDSAGSRYTMTNAPGLDSTAAAYSVDLGADPWHCTLESVDFDGRSSVTFNPFGLPDASGVIVIRAGRERRAITIDAASGQVGLQAAP